jgi:hypothetical protein
MSDKNLSKKTAELKGTQLNTQGDILAYVNHSYVTFNSSERENKYTLLLEAGSQILIWG